ncbi:MAG: exopolysaccharide biosynthesis polyprenyl glycosylphosphotransferase [Akkermansiaceae bacterium]|nr:exopolysaccharide biosynthesis polyprenyl glycosylphosphotransferase [Verrucomicrobiales bacterium]
MLATRSKGIAKVGIACQGLVVSLGFWLWLPISQGHWDIWTLNLPRYGLYNAVLLIGIAFAYVTAANNRWFSQLAFSVCHRHAFRQTSFATGLLLLLLAGERDLTISRIFLFSFLPFLYGILVATQRFLPPLLQRLSFGGVRVQRVLLAGCFGGASTLHGWLRSKERLGYAIAGLLCHDRDSGSLHGFKVLGTLEDLERLIVEQDITQVILVEFPMFRNFLTHYTEVCERHGVRLLVVCDFERSLRHPVTMFEDEGIRFIGLREEPLEDPLGRLGKRCLDIAVALPVVLFILPFTTLLVAYLHWRYSPGPIIFRQLRSGLQNLPFAIYKYRTMHVQNGDPARQATKNDSRIFPGGDLLRKFSLDELPQFINVLRGEMSVVGPRPHLLEHNDLFCHAMLNYPVRGNVKPGITGLAQVRGYRGETRTTIDVINRVESDIHYLENWSFMMDCWIIVRTAKQLVMPPPTAY